MKKGLIESGSFGSCISYGSGSTLQVAEAVISLIMGTNAAFPPFEYTTSQGLVGEFDGIDVAIANKIAEM